jgi:hypothetical protein
MSKQEIIVKFFPDKHQYIDNLGRMYASVTQLLKELFPFDKKAILEIVTNNPRSKYYKRNKQDVSDEWDLVSTYGNLAHKTIENYVKINEEPTPTSITYGCYEQFKKLGWDKVISEQLLFSVPILTAGTCDLIVEKPDCYEIWDIKTNNSLDKKKILQYSMQLNMYKFMAKAILKKPVNVGGILWFEDFFKNQASTKMSIIEPVECNDQVFKVFKDRLNYVKSLESV